MLMSVVLPCGSGWGLRAHRRRFRSLRYRSGQRSGVDDTGDAQRAPEGAAALRKREASRIRMQVRSPTRLSACRIRHDAEMISAEIDRDEPQQLGGWHTLPTADARADGWRVTYQ